MATHRCVDLSYDPLDAPEAEQWLSMAEDDRVLAVEAYHEEHGPGHAEMPNPRLHAAMHAVVENQLAMDDPEGFRSTLDRLIAEGLDRDNAIHAISTVVTTFFWNVAREGKQRFDADEYRQDLAKLSADSWREAFEPPANRSKNK